MKKDLKSGKADALSFNKALQQVQNTRKRTATLAKKNGTANSAAHLKRMAIMAHDGIAKSISPAHTPMDGDTIFAISTSDVSYKEVLENGMKLVILSDDDRNYWKEKSEPIYKNFLEKTGEEGMELFLLINNF